MKLRRYAPVFLALLAVSVEFLSTGGGLRERFASPPPVAHAASAMEEKVVERVVAPGLVEPVSKELRLGFEISGVLEAFEVREGDIVRPGQVLAKLRQDEQRARLEEATALMLAARAEHAMRVAGARPAEIKRAEAALERASTWLDQTMRELERREVMIKSRSIGIEELERARRDVRLADAERREAEHSYALIQELFRREEVEMAGQRAAAAEAVVRQAEAALEKTRLRAPVAGAVLRIDAEPGETYSLFAPSPVLSLGDISVLNVRTEVDERDVGRVRVGQRAFILADALGGASIAGRVSRLELVMTPKRTRSGDPSEPVDRSVREVIVTLDDPGPLYSGMRVDVYIETGPPEKVESAR